MDAATDGCAAGTQAPQSGSSEPLESCTGGALCAGTGTDACTEAGGHEPHEPCPAPLSWQQVVASVHAEAEPWEIRHHGRTVQGRALGSGPAVCFLNGFTGTSDLFALIAWLLRDEFRCYLFDQPRTEGRRRPPRESLQALASDVLAIADAHGEERLHLYGSSFGGLVALETALSAPRRIDRVVLQNAFAHKRLAPLERLLLPLLRYGRGPLARVPGHAALHQRTHRGWFPPYDATRWEFFRDNTLATPVGAFAERARLAAGTDLRPRLADVRAPVLVVRTEGEGRIAAEAQDALAAQLPHVESTSVHTCGQFPHLTHPHRLAKLVRPFLQGEPLPPPGPTSFALPRPAAGAAAANRRDEPDDGA